MSLQYFLDMCFCGGCGTNDFGDKTKNECRIAISGRDGEWPGLCDFEPQFQGYEQFFHASPMKAFFCPEIFCIHRFWGEISSTVSKVLSDRKLA